MEKRTSTSNFSDSQAKIKESAADIINESKKMAGDVYQQGVNKMNEKVHDAEEYMHDYSDKFVKKIHANPIGSVLVAVGVGMLLSSILRK